MDKKIIIIGAVVLLLLGVGAYFLFFAEKEELSDREVIREEHMETIASAVLQYTADSEDNSLPRCMDELVYFGEFEPLGEPHSEGDFNNIRAVTSCKTDLTEGDDPYLERIPEGPQDEEIYKIASDEEGKKIKITTTAEESEVELIQ